MSSITNPWIGTYQRSYQQIKANLLEGLTSIKDKDGNQLITDTSDGNILVIILSMFAAIAEVLHFYIDNAARESFLSTARKYDSVVKHGNLVDYHPRAAIASMVDVTLARSIYTSSYDKQLNIPKGTEFKDSKGNTWLSSRDITWDTNVSTCKVPLIQHTYKEIDKLVNTRIPSSYTSKVQISIGTLDDGLYEEGTMTLQLDAEDWSLVKTFAYSGPDDRHFMVQNTKDNIPVIIFGDDTFGKKPKSGSVISKITCYVTKGSEGNIGAGTITKVPTVISNVISDVSISNINASGGGSDYEDFDMLKEHIPLSVKTLGVAVTKQDFIDYAKQVDGVNKVKLEYECGRKMTLYISPDNSVVAPSALCNRVLNHLKPFLPLTTYLKVKSAGKARIMLEMDVTGKTSFSKDTIQMEVLQALYDRYSPNNSDIGGSVRISDIYALIDNLYPVDYLHITKFYVMPWPKTIVGSKELEFKSYSVNYINSDSTTYYIYFESDTTYTIRSTTGGYVKTDISIDSPYEVNDDKNSNSFTIAFNDNSYENGCKYQFTVSKPNMDYNDPGYNIPVFEVDSQLSITINETV